MSTPATFFPWSAAAPKGIPAPRAFETPTASPVQGQTDFFDVKPAPVPIPEQTEFWDPVLTTGAR